MTADHLHSVDAGDPSHPLVVLVHGSMDRSSGMMRLARRLRDRVHVVRYDRRGYGQSIDVGSPFTIDAQVDDLCAVLDRYGQVRGDGAAPAALVFGHSFGGNVALALADRHPERVCAVAAYETPLPWVDWWPRDSSGSQALAVHDPGEAAERFLRHLLGNRVWDLLPATMQEARRAEGAAMVGELSGVRQGVPPWHPEAIDVPVLALAGQHGRPHHRRSAVELALMVRNGRSEVIGGAGHAGPSTHADQVADLLTAFVALSDGAPG